MNSKCGGNLLSEQLETNSYNSIGLLSHGVLNTKEKQVKETLDKRDQHQSQPLKPFVSDSNAGLRQMPRSQMKRSTAQPRNVYSGVSESRDSSEDQRTKKFGGTLQ